jgi:4a-hydroxytetrahydrobiopterin dehydratase
VFRKVEGVPLHPMGCVEDGPPTYGRLPAVSQNCGQAKRRRGRIIDQCKSIERNKTSNSAYGRKVLASIMQVQIGQFQLQRSWQGLARLNWENRKELYHSLSRSPCSCRMSLRRLYAVSVCLPTARSAILRCCAKPLPTKSCRHLATGSPSGSDSSKPSSPTLSEAVKEAASLRHKPNFRHADPSLPLVEYDTLLGRVRRNVLVSAKTRPETLTTQLSPLLSAHMPALRTTRSVGSNGWSLAQKGDTIIRFFAFDTEADAASFIDSVLKVADEMDHHPEIATIADPIHDTSPLRYVAISCSTHRPPGLSMRDVRLARKIDEIAESFNYMARSKDARRSVLGTIRRQLAEKLRNQRGGDESSTEPGT